MVVLLGLEFQKKLDKQSKEMVFVGYSPERQGYKLYDPATRNVVYSRDVIFDETRFYKEQQTTNDEVIFFPTTKKRNSR